MKCSGCEVIGFSLAELLPDGLCPTCSKFSNDHREGKTQ